MPQRRAIQGFAFGFAGVLLAGATGVTQAQPILERSVIGAGGGVLEAGSLRLVGTIGQPAVGPALAAGNVNLSAGFWASAPDLIGCNSADLAMPFGVLNASDINAFVSGFVGGLMNGTSAADIAPPFGALNASDINAFVAGFLQGCP
ncbi:MAG: GC-type dockerin domain-anchored protein [Planctomycetota bacterium]